MRSFLTTGLALASFLPMAAGAVPIAYKLTSASWVHTADSCLGGPKHNLFMCAGAEPQSFELSIDGGRMSGEFNGVKLKNITAEFKLATNAWFDGLTITGGVLGNDNSHLDYTLHSGDRSVSGRFYFELDGAAPANVFSLERLAIWGQNEDAYARAKSRTGERPLGIQIQAVSVPEPGTLGLLGAALAGLLVRSRRLLRQGKV